MCAAVVVVSVASAAQIPVSSHDRTTDSETPCTTLTLPVSVGGSGWHDTYTAVQVTGIPVACYDLAAQLVVYGAGGAQLVTASGFTGSTGTMTLTTGTYTGAAVQGVALLINTWGMRTSWTPPAGLPPISCIPLNRNNDNSPTGQTCSVVITNPTAYYGNSNPPGGELFGFQFNVTSSTPRWRVTINFDDPYFHWKPRWVNLVAGNVGVFGGCGALPLSMIDLQPPQGSSGEWGAVLLLGQNGPPTYSPGGTQLCP